MNREIKFRIWDNEDKKYLSLQDYQELGAIEVENDGTLTLSPRFRFLTSMMIMPERFVPQQYTGLKDKNGVDIYEGDIVKYHHQTFFKKKGERVYDFKNEKCYVVWDIENAGFCLSKSKDKITDKTFVDLLYMMEDEHMEVIGNIYENEVD